jgi:hypothetical protein
MPEALRAARTTTVFALHSLPATPAEIPERFSSSLLPPSFAAGRCAAIFLPRTAALCGRFHGLTARASGPAAARSRA